MAFLISGQPILKHLEGAQLKIVVGGNMQISRKEKEGVAICYITGEISIDTVPKLKNTFNRLIDNKSRKVLLNFSGVDYIDSVGMATLIKLLKSLKSIEGAIFLSNLSPKIRSIFSITKCEKIFKIYDTEENALKDFCGY